MVACERVLMHTYVGLNSTLWARCWWQSKCWHRGASESAGEGTAGFAGGAGGDMGLKGGIIAPSSPLFSTYDIYSLTFNAKRTSADDNLSLFICLFILSPKEHHISHTYCCFLSVQSMLSPFLNVLLICLKHILLVFAPCRLLYGL